jgi:hypothetical protein
MKRAIIVLLLGGLGACAEVQTATLTPNDPGYWYGGAPQNAPQVRAPGNERVYRPLGHGAVY